MSRPRLVLLALLLAVTTGCSEDTVVGESTVEHPYDGPMVVEQDFSDDANVFGRSGAAGQALECAGEPYSGGGGNYDTGPETVESDAHSGFEAWIEGSGVQTPGGGFVEEREDDGRVLFSYDVGGQTKFAAIAAGDMTGEGETGWGIESWAQCDPSELPESVTDELDIDVWEDADGNRIPVTEINSFQGAEHCDWQQITFLALGAPPDETQFVRDTDGELLTGYDAAARLPARATDTGHVREGRRLWLTDDAAFLVSTVDRSDVERWPKARRPIYCM